MKRLLLAAAALMLAACACWGYLVGFHSRASRCASAICAGASFDAN
jgi:hypothetical protein